VFRNGGTIFARSTSSSRSCTSASLAVPRIALTATADQLTRQEIITRLRLEEARLFVDSFDRPNIRYTIVERDNPRRQLLGFLGAHRGAAGIVYCLSRARWMKPPPG
jgi:superfamily II DNA helicase RecQ